MQKLIERLISKAIHGGWNFREFMNALEEYPPVNLFEWIRWSDWIGNNKRLKLLLLDPDFLKTLIGDEMVCDRCGMKTIWGEHYGEPEMVYAWDEGRCRCVNTCPRHRAIPKYKYIARKVLGLFLDNNPYEAIKLIHDNLKEE